MSQPSIFVSGIVHAVVLTAASVYLAPSLARTEEPTSFVPVEFVTTFEESSVALRVQKTLPIPVAQALAEVEGPKLDPGVTTLPEPVEIEPPPEPEPVPELPLPPPPPHVTQGPPPLAFMDKEERDLRERLQDRIGVQRQGLKLTLVMLGDVLFELNSAELLPQARSLISSVAAELAHSRFAVINVNGFSDTSGTPEYNQQLSEDRAKAVAEELARNGVGPERIHAQGFGDNSLAVATPRGVREARNRRVEIVLNPVD
jgi:outer membrane protein OmpA-like peptidoglycan-associated protein